ncbi:MAG: hypothetical protein NXI20_07225 [bacterium]|nr:hypothetical protein [bacterium]
MKKLLLIGAICHCFLVNAQSPDDALPDRIGVGSHASTVKSVSALLGAALTSNTSPDIFRYKNVTKVEYYDGASWIVDPTEDWKRVLDGNFESWWGVSHATFRITIDLGEYWARPSAIMIGQDYMAGERQFNLKVESSNNQSTWNVRLNDTPSGNGVARSIFMLDAQTGEDRYVRLTITGTSDVGDPMGLAVISGFSQRYTGLKDKSTMPFFTDYNRNIGIGTMDVDGYKLSVEGNVRATEVKVEATPWPDYVFTPSYDLKSLDQVETFINENGHLPNIPSAQEVEENKGIGLGEMNAKLLEKIEELTLHLIQQNKELSELKTQNSNLIKRIEKIESSVEK